MPDFKKYRLIERFYNYVHFLGLFIVSLFFLCYRNQTWGDRDRLQMITLFYVIIIDYIETNLDVVDCIELAFKRGNPIFNVTVFLMLFAYLFIHSILLFDVSACTQACMSIWFNIFLVFVPLIGDYFVQFRLCFKCTVGTS